jgi:membrane protease YdiL (CAAX protease family)
MGERFPFRVPSSAMRTDRSRRARAFAALLILVPAPTIGVWAAMIQWPGAAGAAIFLAAKIWLVILPAAWRLLVDRAPLSLSPARRGGFGVAAGLGLAIGAVIVITAAMIGPRWIDEAHVRAMAEQNGIGTPARFLALAAYWILVNSVVEEYVYRWFVFRQCETLAGGAGGALLSAVLFTIHHVVALKVQFDWRVTVLASAGVFLGGWTWSMLYLRYRSIWPGYLSHAIVDVAVYVVGWRIIFG